MPDLLPVPLVCLTNFRYFKLLDEREGEKFTGERVIPREAWFCAFRGNGGFAPRASVKRATLWAEFVN